MNDTTNFKRQFFNSLKRGTGEAYLIAKENPNTDFSPYIIKGALRNYAYDGQSEDSRAQYIFDLISLSNKKEKIRKSVLNGLATEQNDTWSLTHLFDLAKIYAEQGDNEARQAIYDRFLNNPIEGSDWVGAFEILSLDGLQGLFYIAEKFGKMIEQNPDDWQDSHIISHFQEERPKIKVMEELENLAVSNKYVRIYLDNIRQTEKIQEENWQKRQAQTKKYKNIVDEILHSEHYLGYIRTKKLKKNELQEIAKQLFVEKNLKNIEKLLWIFTSHKFPFDSEFILQLAKQKRNSKYRINEFAICALEFLESKNIRNFALEKILSTKQPNDFLKILVSNFERGDEKLLAEIAKNTNNEHKVDYIACVFAEIFEENETKLCKKPLEILYEKMNCGICRNAIVKILIKNKVLSEKIRKEIKFDSYLETRELIQ